VQHFPRKDAVQRQCDLEGAASTWSPIGRPGRWQIRRCRGGNLLPHLAELAGNCVVILPDVQCSIGGGLRRALTFVTGPNKASKAGRGHDPNQSGKSPVMSRIGAIQAWSGWHIQRETFSWFPILAPAHGAEFAELQLVSAFPHHTKSIEIRRHYVL
jgi:hypothetical protein